MAIREETGTYRELFGRALRKPLALTIMLAIIQQVTGINTVLHYGLWCRHLCGTRRRQRLASDGHDRARGVINLLFTIVGLLIIDKVGYRPLLLTATGGMGLCLVIFSAMLRYLLGRSVLVLVPVLGYVACFAFGLGTDVWVCLAEFFPTASADAPCPLPPRLPHQDWRFGSMCGICRRPPEPATLLLRSLRQAKYRSWFTKRDEEPQSGRF